MTRGTWSPTRQRSESRQEPRGRREDEPGLDGSRWPFRSPSQVHEGKDRGGNYPECASAVKKGLSARALFFPLTDHFLESLPAIALGGQFLLQLPKLLGLL